MSPAQFTKAVWDVVNNRPTEPWPIEHRAELPQDVKDAIQREADHPNYQAWVLERLLHWIDKAQQPQQQSEQWKATLTDAVAKALPPEYHPTSNQHMLEAAGLDPTLVAEVRIGMRMTGPMTESGIYESLPPEARTSADQPAK